MFPRLFSVAMGFKGLVDTQTDVELVDMQTDYEAAGGSKLRVSHVADVQTNVYRLAPLKCLNR